MAQPEPVLDAARASTAERTWRRGGPVTAQLLADLHSSAGNRAVGRLLEVQAAGSTGSPTVGVERILRKGSRGEDVRLLQDHLVQANAGIATDGIFGPITRQAAIAYQREAGLTADGVVGPKTWTSLRTGGVRIPPGKTPGRGFGDSDLTQRVVARLGTVASHLAPFAGGAAGASRAPVAFTAHADLGGIGNGGVTDASTGDHQGVAPDPNASGLDGSVAAAAGHVGGLLAQLGGDARDDLGETAIATTALVGGLVDGTVPLESAVVGLDTVASQLGEKAANQAGKVTGTGSTTVSVVSDTTYKIKGTTIAEVGNALDTHMTTHGEVAHVAPHAGPDGTPIGIEVDYEFSAAARVTRATIKLDLDRVLPEWTNAATTKCACWKKEWDRFEAAIRAHEQEHVNIYTKFLTGLHLKFDKKTMAEADKILDDVFAATERAQADFDTRTDHGQIPAPGTKFAAGTPCTC